MPGNKVSSHPLETLNGVRGVHEVSNTLAWLAEELTSRNENYNTIIVPGGGLVEESRGKGEGVLDRSVVRQQHRVRRTFGPAQHGFECVSSNKSETVALRRHLASRHASLPCTGGSMTATFAV